MIFATATYELCRLQYVDAGGYVAFKDVSSLQGQYETSPAASTYGCHHRLTTQNIKSLEIFTFHVNTASGSRIFLKLPRSLVHAALQYFPVIRC